MNLIAHDGIGVDHTADPIARFQESIFESWLAAPEGAVSP